MKTCPYCDWENEDNASKCLACGTELEVNNTEQESIDLDDKADRVTSEASFGGSEYELYSVIIENIGGNKIAVIKEIKEYFNCGLAEAKQKCESGYVCGGVSQVEAQTFVERLQNVGATAKAVTGEVDPSMVDAPSTQGGVDNGASAVNKKAIIIGAVVAGIIFLSILIAVLI